jgi:hypothetical protein
MGVERRFPRARLINARREPRCLVRMPLQKMQHPAARKPDDWMCRSALRFGLDYLNGDQNSAGATSESLANVAVGTIGMVSTENVPKELPSISAPPEL